MRSPRGWRQNSRSEAWVYDPRSRECVVIGTLDKRALLPLQMKKCHPCMDSQPATMYLMPLRFFFAFFMCTALFFSTFSVCFKAALVA